MKNFVIAAICGALFCAPVSAAENYRDLYRNSKNAEEISFQSSKPYDQVKSCVLDKAYSLAKNADFVKKVAQLDEPLNTINGKGELIHWGKENTSSIEFRLLNGITTVRLFKNFIAYARAPEAERIAIIQPFTFYRDCFEQVAATADTTKLISSPIYTLDSRATAIQMADCVADAAETGWINAHISYNASGYYEVETYSGYSRIPEQLFIVKTAAGSKSLWRRSAQTAFAIIKLDNPEASFDKNLAEKNHILISALKICSDIVDGKIPPRKEKPKPVSRDEIFANVVIATEKRYEEGKIEMAEMPLEVLPLPTNATQYPIKDTTIARIPVRAISAAKVITAGTARTEFWPAVILHNRGGNRAFDKSALNDPSRIAYCNEANGTAILPQLPSIDCYQDLDRDGSFETRRIAFVSQAKSAANIYFIAEKENSTPQKYEIASLAQIPTGYINYDHYSSRRGFGFCTSYRPPTGTYNANTFCYLRSKRLSEDPVTNKALYQVDRIIVSTTLEAKKKDLIQVLESIPSGTIIGRIEARNPVLDFGTTEPWIDRFVQSNRNAPAQTFAAGIDKPTNVIKGKENTILGRENFKPNLQLKAVSVGSVATEPSDTIAPFSIGQKFVGRRFQFDNQVFEPARIFGCTMHEPNTRELINVCIPADIAAGSAFYSDGYLRYVGNTYKYIRSISPIKMEISNEDWADYFYLQTEFVGWDGKKSGKEFAKLVNKYFLEGKLVSSFQFNVELYGGVGDFMLSDAKYAIEKLADGSFIAKPVMIDAPK